MPTAGATHLPSHRRNDSELNRLRREQAFSVQSPGGFLIQQTANIFIVGIGYFCVLLAAALPIFDFLFSKVSLYFPAILCLVGIGLAVFIFLKKKRSIHHAAFIATIAVFTLIFGALYYFPHLRNAS